ncbi:MAG: response regulator [Leptospiraceae bacterium]|nr:response regulator [Leptospiraceae bacterium]MCP5494701.1 response regulator [Leptospiraceae bacterium]
MKPHILLVDDDEVVLMAVSAMIESLGLSCDTAPSPKIAKEKLEISKFQIGIIDLNMKGETGEGLVDYILDKYPDIICVILSATEDVDRIIAVLSHHRAYEFLKKPISIETLKSTIERAHYAYHQKKMRETIPDNEMLLYKKAIEIFDWKADISTKDFKALGPNIIHQMNINFFQGEGLGALISTIQMITMYAKKDDTKGIYEIPTEMFDLMREGLESTNKFVKTLSLAQTMLMRQKEYDQTIEIVEIKQIIEGYADELQSFLSIKQQSITIGNISDYTAIRYKKKTNFDKEAMGIVIRELLTNAMKYSQKNDIILVLFFFTENFFEIKIMNPIYTGKPEHELNEKNLQLIFEPFYRLNNEVDERFLEEGVGYGLGLTVAKRIIELHDGSLYVNKMKNHVIVGRDVDLAVTIRLKIIP